MPKCDECGAGLQVGVRQQRRIRAGHCRSLCARCRGIPQDGPTDADYRFWAERFNVILPTDVPARAALAASGLPPDLERLAVEFDISAARL